MKFNRFIKVYFRYNKTERAGIRTMMILILIVFSFPYVLQSFVSDGVTVEMKAVQQNFDDSLRRVKKNYKKPIKRFTDEIIELNTADTSLLKKVRGLGSYYASKIVRFRDRLGGFSDVSQLKDVKLHDGVYEKIYKQFVVDTSHIRKFDFDTISFKNLLRNPYFDYETVKKVFKIKNEYRGLTPEFLLEQHAIDTCLYFKIRPYCVVK